MRRKIIVTEASIALPAQLLLVIGALADYHLANCEVIGVVPLDLYLPGTDEAVKTYPHAPRLHAYSLSPVMSGVHNINRVGTCYQADCGDGQALLDALITGGGEGALDYVTTVWHEVFGPLKAEED